jgi:hypothetical protein
MYCQWHITAAGELLPTQASMIGPMGKLSWSEAKFRKGFGIVMQFQPMSFHTQQFCRPLCHSFHGGWHTDR